MKYSYIAQSLVKHIRSGFKLPYMVMFETTLMCNMFCEYCIFGEEGKFNDLQTRAARDRIFKRIDEFCEMGIFALSFSGGEPLLNPNTSDYIACPPMASSSRNTRTAWRGSICWKSPLIR